MMMQNNPNNFFERFLIGLFNFLSDLHDRIFIFRIWMYNFFIRNFWLVLFFDEVVEKGHALLKFIKVWIIVFAIYGPFTYVAVLLYTGTFKTSYLYIFLTNLYWFVPLFFICLSTSRLTDYLIFVEIRDYTFSGFFYDQVKFYKSLYQLFKRKFRRFRALIRISKNLFPSVRNEIKNIKGELKWFGFDVDLWWAKKKQIFDNWRKKLKV